MDQHELQLITQALLDGEGYPKSEKDKQSLGYSKVEIRKLLDELLHNKDKQLSEKE